MIWTLQRSGAFSAARNLPRAAVQSRPQQRISLRRRSLQAVRVLRGHALFQWYTGIFVFANRSSAGWNGFPTSSAMCSRNLLTHWLLISFDGHRHGQLVGWPLMIIRSQREGPTADALSRSMASYRPLAISGTLPARLWRPCHLFVGFMASLMVFVGKWGIGNFGLTNSNLS